MEKGYFEEYYQCFCQNVFPLVTYTKLGPEYPPRICPDCGTNLRKIPTIVLRPLFRKSNIVAFENKEGKKQYYKKRDNWYQCRGWVLQEGKNNV